MRKLIYILLGVGLLSYGFFYIFKHYGPHSNELQVCDPKEETKMPGTFN